MLHNFKSNPQSETKNGMEAVKDRQQSASNRQEHKERQT